MFAAEEQSAAYADACFIGGCAVTYRDSVVVDRRIQPPVAQVNSNVDDGKD